MSGLSYLSVRLRYIGPLSSPCQRQANILSMVATLQQQSTPGPTSRIISPRSPCGRYIVSGSGDPWAYLWNVGRPGSPVARLVETMAEVTCVAWCQDSSTGSGLATLVMASHDMRHQLWRQRLETLETSRLQGHIHQVIPDSNKCQAARWLCNSNSE